MQKSGQWRVAPFDGSAEQIGIDLDGPQPQAVSEVLVACQARRAGNDTEWHDPWQMDISSRLQALLQVALASGMESLEFTADCGGCGDRLSLDLALKDFVTDPGASTAECQTAAGDCFEVRVPTGNDQRRWLEQGDAGAEEMARDLLTESLSVDGEELLAAVEKGLSAVDPFTALEIHSACPGCEAQVRLAVDLEAELLHCFRRRQAERLRDVHRLAVAYHWSEESILGLPAFRREFYLACLRAEGRL